MHRPVGPDLVTSLTHAAEIADVREQTYYLLLALTDGPLHGYAIAQRVGELSGGRVTLSAGTLSGALDRLLSQGDLRIDREETVQGRLRRYYRLADHGAAASRRRPTG